MTAKTATREPELFTPAKEAPASKPPATRTKQAKRGTATKGAVVVHEPKPSAPMQQPRSVLELCMMAAKDPSIPTDRVKAFLEMAEAEERKEAEVLFDHAMLAAQAEMPAVPRDSFNKHTRSWWARIESVSAKIDPVAKKHGFTLKYGVGDQRIEDHYHLYVDVTWTGELASGKRASFTKRYDADIGRDDKGPKGEGTKTLAQGAGSSITYGRRFLKCMVFDVLVLGMDKDGNPAGADDGGAITDKQAGELKSLCAEKGIDLATFQRAFRVDAVEALPAIRFDDVKARLKTAPKAQQQQAENVEAQD